MQQIGIRELRQSASTWIKRVIGGEAFEITDRGRVVALLRPIPQGNEIDRLNALGRISSGDGDLAELGNPLKSPKNQPLPSKVLTKMRNAER